MARWRKQDPHIRRALTIVMMLAGALAFGILVLFVPSSRMTDPAVKLLTAMIWPFVLLLLVVVFREPVDVFVSEIARRVKEGDDFSIWQFALKKVSLSEKAALIPTPSKEELITMKNVALLHTSFIPKHKRVFGDGLTYLQIEIIVIALNAVMERIDHVTYRLDDAYPLESREQVRSDSRDRFKLKELANGTSIVRAEITFRDQKDSLHLNRFIDLRPDGPRI